MGRVWVGGGGGSALLLEHNGAQRARCATEKCVRNMQWTARVAPAARVAARRILQVRQLSGAPPVAVVGVDTCGGPRYRGT